MRTIVTARNYGTWLFERFNLAELCAGAAVLVGFEDEYYRWIRFTKTDAGVWVPAFGDLCDDDEDTFSYEMSDAELVRGMTKMHREVGAETVVAPRGLVGDRVES
jgi:hypothetical protein